MNRFILAKPGHDLVEIKCYFWFIAAHLLSDHDKSNTYAEEFF